jgi:hypothetical protein
MAFATALLARGLKQLDRIFLRVLELRYPTVRAHVPYLT